MTKVLIVDDESVFREHLMELLHFEGYDAYGAADGILAIESALQLQPDLIICDIMMPRLDGYAVLKTLRQNASTAHIPFIFISALPVSSLGNLLLNHRATAYLAKPFTYKEFLKTIQTSIAVA